MNRKGFGLYGNAEPEISCHPAHCTMERWDFGTPQRWRRNDSGHCVIHAFFTAPVPSSSFIPIIFQKGGQRIPSFSFHRHREFSDKKRDFLKSFQHSCCRFPKILRFRSIASWALRVSGFLQSVLCPSLPRKQII